MRFATAQAAGSSERVTRGLGRLHEKDRALKGKLFFFNPKELFLEFYLFDYNQDIALFFAFLSLPFRNNCRSLSKLH